MLETLADILDVIVPRFIREDVALEYNDEQEGWDIVCSVKDIQEGEEFEAFATVKSFNLFGYGLFPRMVGEVMYELRPYKNGSR